MHIIHCIPVAQWQTLQHCADFGHASISQCGFVHCSSIEYLWRVAPNFEADAEPRLLLLIDTDQIQAPIRWEDGGEGRLYPHVYGPIPASAVAGVLPYLRDASGRWRKNPELADIADR